MDPEEQQESCRVAVTVDESRKTIQLNLTQTSSGLKWPLWGGENLILMNSSQAAEQFKPKRTFNTQHLLFYQRSANHTCHFSIKKRLKKCTTPQINSSLISKTCQPHSVIHFLVTYVRCSRWVQVSTGNVGPKQVNLAIHHLAGGFLSSGSSCWLLQLPLLYRSQPLWPPTGYVICQHSNAETDQQLVQEHVYIYCWLYRETPNGGHHAAGNNHTQLHLKTRAYDWI